MVFNQVLAFLTKPDAQGNNINHKVRYVNIAMEVYR